MKLCRRYVTFSLRTLFVVLTALGVWLGVIVNRAREQQDAAAAIEALGGDAYYDWQVDHTPTGHWVHRTTGEPDGPVWLRRLIGNDFFHEVTAVGLRPLEADILKSIAYLQRLRGLKVVMVRPQPRRFSAAKQDELNAALVAALPNCEIIWRSR